MDTQLSVPSFHSGSPFAQKSAQLKTLSEADANGVSGTNLDDSGKVGRPALRQADGDSNEVVEISVSKQEVNKALRNPETLLTENARLASEVPLCNVLDDDYGPVSGGNKFMIKHLKSLYNCICLLFVLY